MCFIHSDLMCYLINVSVYIVGKEIKIYVLSIVKLQDIFVPQNFRRFIYGMVIHVNHNTIKFCIRKGCRMAFFFQLFRVEFCKLCAEIGKDILIGIQFDKAVSNTL